MPVTVMAGAEEVVVPAGACGTPARGILHSTLAVLPGCGHMVHYVAGEAIAEALMDRAGTLSMRCVRFG